MNTLRARWALLAACLALAACGGGGGSDNDGPEEPPITDAPVVIAASQSGAEDLVDAVNAGVDDVFKADAAGALPGGVNLVALPSAATSQGTIECSSYGGTGNITYSYTINDSSYQPVSYQYSYNNCTFNSGGYSARFNGSVSLTYEYTSSNNFTYTQIYDLAYSYTYGSQTYETDLNSTRVCSSVSGVVSCSYQVGDNRIRNVSVTRSGTVTTVRNATVTRGTVTWSYSGWAFDASSGRATSGTVTVSDDNGNSATITVTSSGYRVTIVYNGSSTVYTVSA